MDGMFFIVFGTLLSLSPASPLIEMTPASSLQTPAPGDDAAPPPASSVSRDHWITDSNDTRLLLGPTARSLKRGEAYIDDVGLFFPSVQVGLSDRVSIGAGAPIVVPAIDIHPGDAFWITPKVQVFAGQKTQAALGVVHIAALGHHAGIAYGVATRGTSNAAVTLGLGLAYPHYQHRRPLVLVAGEKRVSPRVKLITENYFPGPGGDALLTGGVRVIRRHRTLDLSWYKFPGGPVYPVPVIRFSLQISGPDR
jgi:hypothetical protein